MALPDSALQKVGTQLRFIAASGYSPADVGTDFTIGTPTDVLLTLSALADGAARQSDKFDFGENRARAFDALLAADFTGETPTAGERFDLFFARSTSATQGTGNVAGNSGADAAAPGGALGSITLAEFLAQCDYIGSFIVHDGAVVQNGPAGLLAPPTRYGQLIYVNESGDALEADNVESAAFLTPIEDVQID